MQVRRKGSKIFALLIRSLFKGVITGEESAQIPDALSLIQDISESHRQSDINSMRGYEKAPKTYIISF